jgi:hypothetical protein
MKLNARSKVVLVLIKNEKEEDVTENVLLFVVGTRDRFNQDKIEREKKTHH